MRWTYRRMQPNLRWWHIGGKTFKGDDIWCALGSSKLPGQIPSTVSATSFVGFISEIVESVFAVWSFDYSFDKWQFFQMWKCVRDGSAIFAFNFGSHIDIYSRNVRRKKNIRLPKTKIGDERSNFANHRPALIRLRNHPQDWCAKNQKNKSRNEWFL